MKKVKSVIGIKSFDMDLKCLGFQFEIGKTYESQGELIIYHNGFHFHHNSQLKHVFEYYVPAISRFCLVIGEDVLMNKKESVARKITIIRELSLQEIIDIRIGEMAKQGITEKQDEDYCVVIQSGSRDIASQTGYRGLAIQTGDGGSAMQTGHQGLAIQKGRCGTAIQSGDFGSATQTGDYGLAYQTRYRGTAMQIGKNGSATQTGDYGSAIQDGKNGVAMAMGIQGRAMVKNSKGAIIIQNWIQGDHKWQVKNILRAEIGDILPNGEIMKKNTWYWYENGVLKSTKNKN